MSNQSTDDDETTNRVYVWDLADTQPIYSHIDLTKYVNGTIIRIEANPFDSDTIWVTVEGEVLPRLIKLSELE